MHIKLLASVLVSLNYDHIVTIFNYSNLRNKCVITILTRLAVIACLGDDKLDFVVTVLTRVVVSPVKSSSAALQLTKPNATIQVMTIPKNFFIFYHLLIVIQSFKPDLLLQASALRQYSGRLLKITFRPKSSFTIYK